ncbi:MAG TPA: universal stress protein [Stellaceae bacterium]|nr:universal stress protein [Stellaceae bacterium]
MSNVVLALLTRTETAPAILAGAECLATMLADARIEVMIVRIAPLSIIMPTEEILTADRELQIRARETDRAAALHAIFDQWARGYTGGDAPRWIDEEGTLETFLESRGRRADYIVVGRPDTHPGHADHSALHAALFDTDRPVLIMPPQSRADFGRIVAIAWREDKFTLRAVLAALRCIDKAEQVHVLMGRKDGAPAPRIPEALTEHRIAVTPHELPIGKEKFGAQLLAQAHELKADLLVMGAFTHGTWHSLLFGGVTKHILAHTDLPVLMRH